MPHSRRILLAVTGMSPQIVTETLYALGVENGAHKGAFLPTEIHRLTTATGAQEARTALLHPDGGQFHALLADYPQLGNPRFDDTCIHIIRNAAGEPLADIRTPEENALAADTITDLMAELTSDPGAALHVSIAGGRKTMGFYLGYAFSLYARPQDELSHVLVSSPFEGHPDFFFKPATPKRLTTRDNRNIDTAAATITLARIPVVRLRHGLPQELLERRASFNDTVAAIQQSLSPPHLRIHMGNRTVECGGTTINGLPPVLFAWFAWWARQAIAGTTHGPNDRKLDTHLLESFLPMYREMLIDAEESDYYKNAKSRMEKFAREYFEENNSKLNRLLRSRLGVAAHPYLLESFGKRPNTQRRLQLPPSAIELIE